MSTVKMTWNQEEAEAQLFRKAEAGMRAGLVILESIAKEKLKISNFGGTSPSAPGEYPHARTGTLRSHVMTQYKGVQRNLIVGALGIQAGATLTKKTKAGKIYDYALLLELGTSKMAARPYLRPTVLNHGKAFTAAFVRTARAAK